MADRTTEGVPETVRTVPPPPGPGGASGVPAQVDAAGAVDPAPPHPNGGASDPEASDPDSMRREIERTRARMAGTLDEIEDRLVAGKEDLLRTKDELWARVTLRELRQGVSREPWRSVAIAFVVGYVVAAIRD